MPVPPRQELAELYDRTSPTAFRLALCMVRDRGRAEQVLEEAYADLWAERRTLDPARSLTELLVHVRERARQQLAGPSPA